MTTPITTRSPSDAVRLAYERITADARTGIWIDLVDEDVALAAAHEVEEAMASGRARPLAGTTLAVKNNIDVRGIRTTAACPSFGAVAQRHAPVVQSLVDAGAVVVGVTNLDQFATGLVGTRSPYGACPNAHWPALISGGSSSGSGVAVAAGLVDLAVGTDTAGSGRVPAAANGIIGLKPTRERVSTVGMVPACPSFDCASLFGSDIELLRTAFEVVSSSPSQDAPLVARIRVGRPRLAGLTFDGDADAASRFERASAALVRALDGEAVELDVAQFVETGQLLYGGAFVKERHDAVGAFIEAHPDDIDPIVYSIIHAAGEVTSEQLDRDRRALEQRRRSTREVWDRVDVMVLPTVPRLPRIDEVRAEPVAVNAMLGTYTNFVNLLGLCAITVPVGAATVDGPPTSVTVIARGGKDELLLDVAARLAHPDAR